jgi:aromatic-L-amino-acid decarboxylase
MNMQDVAEMEPDRSLFPDGEQRAIGDADLGEHLAQAAERVRKGPVAPSLDLGRFRSALESFDFAAPRGLDEVIPWTIDQLLSGITQVTHPRYFGLFNPAPTFPSQCADRIVAAFNPQLATWTTSPAAVEIEQHVIRSVAKRVGMHSESSGHFTTGGTEANYTAVICALTQANPDFATAGVRVFPGPVKLYVSNEAHRAWFKIAHQAGIGREAVRLVDTDGTGRLNLCELSARINADRAEGYVPIMVAATAGTTGAGMIDPLRACADIAHKAGLWYHVDAAWGGALIASERLAHHLSGIEKADSVTIDAHKWFATTMGCGMFFTSHPRVLPLAFEISTAYMPSHALGLDPYLSSIQWSRRFLGLRLFLSLASGGWGAYALHIERAVGLADLLRAELRKRAWTVINDSELAVLCVDPPEGSTDVRAIVSRVVASGRAWVSVAEFEGHETVRLCITNGETGRGDIIALVEALEDAR